MSNVNLANVGIYGNTGNVQQNLEPGIPKAIALVPKGTTIPASAMVSQATFAAYIIATTHGFIADSRKNRWFLLQDLDDFKDVTKEMATVDTGLNQFGITKFNTKYEFRYLTNKANHQEALSFDNAQNQYDVYVWDALSQVWGQKDPTGAGGITAYTLQQIRIMDWKPYSVKDMNEYFFTVQFKNRAEFNENFAIFNSGVDSDNIAGLTNAVATDVTATLATALGITTSARTDMVITLKSGNGSIDLLSSAYYQATMTAACFVLSNLSVPATVAKTMTTGTVVVAGQVYNYAWFVFTAITSTNLLQAALAAPSVVNAIISNFDSVTEIVQVGVDGQNAAVRTMS